MRPYETMVIFDTGADEAAVNGVLDRALDALKAKGGNPGAVERWGRRTFAYELQHKREGYYVVIELTAEPAPWPTWSGCSSWPTRCCATRSSGYPTRWRAAGPTAAAARRRRRRRRADHGQRNAVTLVGNITRDPELRFTNTGQATASFGLAVNRRWQNRQTQEWEEATSFFDVVCWREMAENAAESLTRGAAGHRHRAARPAQLGDAGRRQAVQGRSGGRRDRPEHPLGHGPGHQERASGSRRRWRLGRRRWRRTAAPAGRAAAAQPASRQAVRIQRGALLDGAEQRSWRQHAPAGAEGHRAADQEEALCAVQGPGGVGRLQGRRHAPQVHERPRARSGPAGCRGTAPSTSGTWPSPSRRPGSWSCCRTPSAPRPNGPAVVAAGAVVTAVRRPGGVRWPTADARTRSGSLVGRGHVRPRWPADAPRPPVGRRGSSRWSRVTGTGDGQVDRSSMRGSAGVEGGEG